MALRVVLTGVYQDTPIGTGQLWGVFWQGCTRVRWLVHGTLIGTFLRHQGDAEDKTLWAQRKGRDAKGKTPRGSRQGQDGGWDGGWDAEGGTRRVNKKRCPRQESKTRLQNKLVIYHGGVPVRGSWWPTVVHRHGGRRCGTESGGTVSSFANVWYLLLSDLLFPKQSLSNGGIISVYKF